MCIAAGIVPLHRLARTYHQRATNVARSVKNLPALASVLTALSMYSGGLGNWGEIQDALGEALEIANQLGDQRQLGESTTVLALASTYQGDLNTSRRLFSEICEMTRQNGNALQRAWGLVGLGGVQVLDGQSQEGIQNLEMALQLLTENTDLTEEIRAYGYLALAHLQLEQYEVAQQAAQNVLRLTGTVPPSVYTTLEGYVGVAKTYLTLWNLAQDQQHPQNQAWRSQLDELETAAKKASKALHGYARIFPIGQPSDWLYRGLIAWQRGASKRAMRAWKKSLAAAQQLGMVYDQARACEEIGLHLPQSDPERGKYLQRAVELFAASGAKKYANQLRPSLA